jgi:spermidine/putrescine transport system ATP-binding protein
MDFLVEIKNASKRYGEHAALEDVSLGVRRGEFLTLLGPSGSGKTTLLRLVAGFAEPESGQVLIEGRDASGLPPYRRNVNTVFQHYALFPHLSVFRNVAFGLEQKNLSSGEIERRVRRVLELVELPGKEDRYPSQLSGGEQQRVALARALVLEPTVLLLDEPLGSLDQKLRQQMQVELKRLQQRLGITFVFVTHDQGEALVMSDRIAVINGGHLEQVGTPEEIYERPRTRFVAEFMGVENFFEVSCTGHTAEGTSFETPTGLTFWAGISPGIAKGAAASLAVRSSAVSLTCAPPEPRPLNLLQGTITEALYEGAGWRWSVAVDGAAQVVVRRANTLNDSALDRVTPGAPVYLSWEPERSLVYSGEAFRPAR